MSEKEYVENAEINNTHTVLRLRKDGIIELSCNENHVYEVSDIQQNHSAIRELSEGKMALVLSLVGKYTSISKEATDFIAQGEHRSFIRAEAFVLHSLAHKILARFYVKIKKPVVKTAYFTEEKEAAEWLLKQ